MEISAETEVNTPLLKGLEQLVADCAGFMSAAALRPGVLADAEQRALGSAEDGANFASSKP